MKKLSKISESIWSDIQDRSSGEVVRDEDKFNPDYVDFGPDTTVYWAIDNLEIDGEVKFYFDDVKDYNNNGWRLPTVDEVNQLKWNIRIYWLDGCKHLKFDDEQELKLKTNGSGGFHMWTKEINTKFPSSAYAYGFDNSYNFDISNFNKSINKLFVFLVKDKKITESIWSDIQDRSSGDIVRKEDDIRDLKPEEFVDYLREIYDDGSDKGFGYKGVHLAKYGIMKSYSSKYIDITIPFDVVDDIIRDYRIVRHLYIEINNITYEYEPIAITDGEDIEELLSKNGYVFEKRLPPDSPRVYPQKGETTNQTVINLIDLLLKNAKEPMLKRK